MQNNLSDEVFAYICEHVFWPRQPKQKQSDDIQHRELDLLRFTSDALRTLATSIEPVLEVSQIVANWRKIQTHEIDAHDLLSQLTGLQIGNKLPLFVRQQNAGIIMTRVKEGIRCETFEVSFSAEQVSSAKGSLRCEFPGPCALINNDRLADGGFLNSFATQLASLCNNAIDDAQCKTYKAKVSDYFMKFSHHY
jgi:hypothetical protein